MAIEFEVKLSDGVTAAAGSAAHEVDVLQKALRSLQTQMLPANAVADDKAYQKAGERYQKAMARLKELGGENQKFGIAAKATQGATQGASGGIAKLGEAFTNANQPAGMMGQIVKALGPEMMALVGVALAAAAAIAAVATAIIGAIKVAGDFAQQQRGLENTFNALGRGTTTGKQMSAMFDELGKVLPMSREQMAALNTEMMKGGVTDIPRLMQATKAAAAVNAIFNDSTGKAGEKVGALVVEINKAIKTRTGIGDLEGSLKDMGISAEEVAAKMGIGVRQLKMMAASGVQLNKIGNAIQDALIRKGIGPMRDMMSTWDMVTKRIKDIGAKLFSGISETSGFKQFSEQLVRLLDSFGDQAKNAKGGVTSVFDAMFKVGALVLRELRYGMLRFEIAILQATIAVAPLVKAIQKTDDALNASQRMVAEYSSVWKGLKIIFGLVAGSIALMTAPFILLGAAIVAVGTAIAWVIGKIGEGLEWISANIGGWIDAGKDMMKGLWKGIKNGAKDVKDAIVNVAKDAMQGFKDALGIKSPSKVFAQFGVHTTMGFAQGVKQSAPAAMSATSDMASKAIEGGKQGVTAAPYAGAARGGLTVNVGGITIQGGSGSSVDLLEEAVVSLFERVALTQGVA